MKHILSLHTTASDVHHDGVVNFMGEEIRLTQYSTNFDFNLAQELIKRYDGQVDAIAVSGLPPTVDLGKKRFSHPERDRLLNTAHETPVLDGQMLKEIYMPWTIRKFFLKNPATVRNKKIAFYSGALQQGLLEVMEDFTSEMCLADPYFLLGLPFSLGTGQGLKKFLGKIAPIMKRAKIRPPSLRRFDKTSIVRAPSDFLSSDVFVGNMATIELIDTSHLRGKLLILDVLSNELKRKLARAHVRSVLVCLPQMINGSFTNYAIMEALIQAVGIKKKELGPDTLLSWVEKIQISPELLELSGPSNDGMRILTLGTKDS
jgi:hypothetical protein